MLVDPAHEFPGSSFFIGNFLDFEIKKELLGGFDCFLKDLPVFKSSLCPVISQGLVIVFVLPALGMSSDIDELSIISPCMFNV